MICQFKAQRSIADCILVKLCSKTYTNTRALLRTLLSLTLIVGLLLAVALPAGAAPTTKADPKAAAKKQTAPVVKKEPKPTSKFEEGKLNLPTAKESAKDAKKVKTSKAGSIWRMLFGLGFVLLVIFSVHWLLKKFSESKSPSLSAAAGIGGLIEVVSTTPLAANRNLHLVRIGTDLVLIGATEQSITQLQTVDAGQLSIAAGNAGNSEFQSALNGALSPNSNSNGDTFLKRFVANVQLMTSR